MQDDSFPSSVLSDSKLNDCHNEWLRAATRRQFFGRCATGIGSLALASLLKENLLAANTAPSLTNPLAPHQPHFAPRARRAIYIHMAGSPSQLELFDPKPRLK